MKTNLKAFCKDFRMLTRLYSSAWPDIRQAIRGIGLIDGKKPSYIQGPSRPKLISATMGQIIDASPDLYGDTEAVVDVAQGIRKTFVQFKKEVDQVAIGFLALNFKHRDLIGIWSPNRYEWMLVQMAAAKAGLILATINPAFQKPEFEYILKKLELKALIVPENFKSQDFYKIISDVVPEMNNTNSGKIKSRSHPYLTDVIMMTDKNLPGIFKFNDLYSAGGSDQKRQMDQLQNQIQFDDALNLQFTSGTTGRPKGATLSHFGIVNNIIGIAENLGFFDEHHRLACSVPLFHCFGCVVGSYNTMLTGATCVFPSMAFDPEKILQAIEKEKCNCIYGTPTMFIDILNHPNFNKTDVSLVKKGLLAGASIPPDLFERTAIAFDAPEIMIAYGSTELSPLITIQHFSEPVSQKKNNVGSVLHNTEIKIVDTQDQIVPIGCSGEICARGFQVMKGYWNDEEKTKETIIDGWYHTGDIGVLSEDGRVSVIGRIKDIIIRGGENVYPKEIEDFLITHPKILDAQVIGIPNERLGEEVCVWVQLKENQNMSEEDLRAFCKGQIAHYKIPKHIHFTESFPKTVSGKIQKFIMREEMGRILKKVPVVK